MKVGQWIFCVKRKHDFSEAYDDYHIVFKGYFHEYIFDLFQTKTGVNLIELRL